LNPHYSGNRQKVAHANVVERSNSFESRSFVLASHGTRGASPRRSGQGHSSKPGRCVDLRPDRSTREGPVSPPRRRLVFSASEDVAPPERCLLGRSPDVFSTLGKQAVHRQQHQIMRSGLTRFDRALLPVLVFSRPNVFPGLCPLRIPSLSDSSLNGDRSTPSLQERSFFVDSSVQYLPGERTRTSMIHIRNWYISYCSRFSSTSITPFRSLREIIPLRRVERLCVSWGRK
jgi:hypothetical protein